MVVCTAAKHTEGVHMSGKFLHRPSDLSNALRRNKRGRRYPRVGMDGSSGWRFAWVCVVLVIGMVLPLQVNGQRIVLEQRVVTSGTVVSQQPGV